MFSLELTNYSKCTATKLCQLLLEKPHLAHLTKHLQLLCDHDLNFDYSNAMGLLRANFASSMKSVSTALTDADTLLFASLIDTAEHSLKIDFRLRMMPQPVTRDGANYIKAAYTFKNTLQELTASLNCKEMDTLLDRFRGFKQLQNLGS